MQMAIAWAKQAELKKIFFD